MHLPKVEFKLPSIANEAKRLYNFCCPRSGGWDWSYKIYKVHPDLQKIIRGNLDKDNLYNLCYGYAKKFIKEHKSELKELTFRYQNEWDKTGDKYLMTLSKYFKTDYPKLRKIARAYVSIVPVFPRFLDKWSFNVGHKKPEYMRLIAAHEILHFLYFKKWKEIFPQAKRSEFESPHLVWRLSEILAPIILNNHPDIHRIVGHRSGVYEEFRDLKIGNKKLMIYFEDLYKKHLKEGSSFESFLRLSWEKTRCYRDIIESA